MTKYNFTSIALYLLLLSFNVNSSFSPPKGLKCDTPVNNNWTEIEKSLLKKTVNKDNISDFFFMPTNSFFIDNNWCWYKNIFFVVGFQESDHGGKILISESFGKIKSNTKNDKIVSIEYGVYQEKPTTEEHDDYFNADYYLDEILKLKTGLENKFYTVVGHKNFLWRALYVSFIVVTYENNRKELYAMKVRPKG